MREEDYLKNENEDLMRQIDELKKTIDECQRQLDVQSAEKELAYRNGVIYGLKYAIRCNGVSGGEVN